MDTISDLLKQMDKFPKEFVGKNIITVFESPDRKLAIGLFDEIMVVEDKKRTYKKSYTIPLQKEFLDETLSYVLSLVRELHDRADKVGIKIKKGKAWKVLNGGK